MGKTEFAKTLIAKMESSIGKDGQSFSESSAPNAMQALVNGITEYLVQNTLVEVTYSGMIPGTPPIPDPLVKDVFHITGQCAPVPPSSDFNDWLKKIEANIIAGFQLAPSGNMGLVFPQVPFLNTGIILSQNSLAKVCDDNPDNPQIKVWELICSAIMDWVNSIAFNPTPSAANNPITASVGTANIAKITLT